MLYTFLNSLAAYILSLSLHYSVILWVYPLFRSEISCFCYITSEWKASVSRTLINFADLALGVSLHLFMWFLGLGSLSKLIGHMLVVRGRIHQVGGWCFFLCANSKLKTGFCNAMAWLAWALFYTVIMMCRSLQHFCGWSQSWGYRCYIVCLLFCLSQLFVSFKFLIHHWYPFLLLIERGMTNWRICQHVFVVS